MIEKININNFRGFKELKVNNLKKITLISGANNIGKSSLLEALFFTYDRINGSPFLKMNRMRGDNGQLTLSNTWESAFYNMDISNPIVINMVRNGQECSLRYEKEDISAVKLPITENPTSSGMLLSTAAPYALKMIFEAGDYREEGDYVFYPSFDQNQFVNPIRCTLRGKETFPLRFENMFISGPSFKDDLLFADLFSRVEMKNRKSELLEILQIIDSDIQDIIMLSLGNYVQLYVKKNDVSIPLKYCGDGLVKVANIVLHLMSDDGSVLMFDEVENGIHYSVQEQLWKSIAKISIKYDCQLIATTHSYECLSAAYSGIESEGIGNDFAFVRLQKGKKGISAEEYTFEEFGYALSAELEVR